MSEHKTETDHVLATSDLRVTKPSRHDFALSQRHPITVVLDGVQGHYNQGAFFRLCDAFLVHQLIICGATVTLHNRRFVQAAAATHRWVPWKIAIDARQVIYLLRHGSLDRGIRIDRPKHYVGRAGATVSAVVVLGGEVSGVSQVVLDLADEAVAIPMLGMANSLKVATAGAILLHQMTGHLVGRVEDQANVRSPW